MHTHTHTHITAHPFVYKSSRAPVHPFVNPHVQSPFCAYPSQFIYIYTEYNKIGINHEEFPRRFPANKTSLLFNSSRFSPAAQKLVGGS